MITDAALRVSDNQSITKTGPSENVIDLGQNRDIGEGKELFMHFAVTETFAGGKSVIFHAITSPGENMTTYEKIGISDTYKTVDLEKGTSIVVPISPKIGSTGHRYLGAQYVVDGAMTAGNVTADIVETFEDGKKLYPSGSTIT